MENTMNLVHIMLVIYSTIECQPRQDSVFSSRLSHQQSSENKDRVVLAFWEYEGIITKRTDLQKQKGTILCLQENCCCFRDLRSSGHGGFA